MAAALRREDISAWAAAADIKLIHADSEPKTDTQGFDWARLQSRPA